MIVNSLKHRCAYQLDTDVILQLNNIYPWRLSRKSALADKLATEIGLTFNQFSYSGDVLIPQGTIIHTGIRHLFKIYLSRNGIKIPENKGLPRGLIRLSYNWECLDGKSVTPR